MTDVPDPALPIKSGLPDPTSVDEYKLALETRNFEIRLFWQRSNYFLVLNTAVGTGFFAVRSASEKAALWLGALGTVAAWLWIMVNLGSRYWQVRWEQKVEDIEEGLRPAYDHFFLASRSELDDVVAKGLRDSERKQRQEAGKRRRIDRELWRWAVLKRPSVSMTMTYFSCAFLVFWLVAELWLGVRYMTR